MTKSCNSPPLRLELSPDELPKPRRFEQPGWKAAYEAGIRAQREVARLIRDSEAVNLGQLIRRKCNILIDAYGHTHELQEPGCDWFGHLTGGRAVYLEVKHSSGQSLALECFSKHQLTELERASNDGACAVVVVVCEQPQLTFYALPWRVIARARAERKRESLSLDELKPWAVSTLLLASRAFCEEIT